MTDLFPFVSCVAMVYVHVCLCVVHGCVCIVCGSAAVKGLLEVYLHQGREVSLSRGNVDKLPLTCAPFHKGIL